MIRSVLGALPEAREWSAADGTVIKYRWSAPDKVEPGKTCPLMDKLLAKPRLAA